MMTREELLFEIEFYKSAIKASGNHTVFLKEKLQDYEKQLAELEVYEPMYLSNVGKCVYATEYEKYVDNKYIERHNAGEELKKIISEENAKQGWKVDWDNQNQRKHYISGINVGSTECFTDPVGHQGCPLIPAPL